MMIGSYKGYRYEIHYKQNQQEAWYADIAITRPDGTPLGPYRPHDRGANPNIEVIQSKAKDLIYSEIDQDTQNKSFQTDPLPAER